MTLRSLLAKLRRTPKPEAPKQPAAVSAEEMFARLADIDYPSATARHLKVPPSDPE